METVHSWSKTARFRIYYPFRCAPPPLGGLGVRGEIRKQRDIPEKEPAETLGVPRRRTGLELLARRIHVIPGLRVPHEQIHGRLVPRGIVHAAGRNSHDLRQSGQPGRDRRAAVLAESAIDHPPVVAGRLVFAHRTLDDLERRRRKKRSGDITAARVLLAGPAMAVEGRYRFPRAFISDRPTRTPARQLIIHAHSPVDFRSSYQSSYPRKRSMLRRSSSPPIRRRPSAPPPGYSPSPVRGNERLLAESMGSISRDSPFSSWRIRRRFFHTVEKYHYRPTGTERG